MSIDLLYYMVQLPGMTRDERPYVTAFSHMMGVGPLAYDVLLAHFDTSYDAYRAPYKQLARYIGSAKARIIAQYRMRHDPLRVYERIVRKNIRVILRSDTSYPPLLQHIYDKPICLYAKGDTSLIDYARDFPLAVVGTRDPSPYGIQMTRTIVSDLARAGMVIVSGMAEGIDSAAHEACLAEGGRTVVILGCGVDIVYPPSNRKLYDRIVASGGIILSEFPPGMTVLKGLFVSRNRIIAGMARGLLIVEGSEKSGALISARCAVNQNKEVFAVPGLVTSDVARAPHIMIREGVRFVTCAQHIMEEYNVSGISRASADVLPELPDDERVIYRHLLRQSGTIDDIVVGTGMSVASVLNTISMLEIKGLIRAGTVGYSALSPA